MRAGRAPALLRHVLAMQVPMRPERRLARAETGCLAEHLRGWAGPSSPFPGEEETRVYQAAMALWPSSHCALEYHRWLVRSRVRTDGRSFNRLMRAPVSRPVCCVYGAEDPALPAAGLPRSGAHVSGPYEEHVLPGVGHFPHEEDPRALSDVLLDWLGRVR
jgi:pimeloyl-ACP methyl ester carboxylesterase